MTSLFGFYITMAIPPNRVGGTIKRLTDYPDHLKAIGLVITEFGRLEQSLAILLWELIEDPDRGDAVFYSLGNSKARCDVIRGVANEVLEPDSEIMKEVLEVIRQARDVADKRNDLAHGAWGEPSQKKENPFCEIKRPATKNPVFSRRWTVSELTELADKIDTVDRRAGMASMVLRALRDPSEWAFLDRLAKVSEPTRVYLSRFRSEGGQTSI